MSEVSQIDQLYPHENGKGIDFSSLFQQTSDKGEFHGTWLGESGKKLTVNITPKVINILDHEDDHFVLSAQVIGPEDFPVVGLNLRTVVDGNFLWWKQKQHHKDMFAGKFMQLAVTRFQEVSKIPIAAVLGEWGSLTDNAKQYIEAYASTQDKVKAAQSTWTGAQANALGFNAINPEDIRMSLQTNPRNSIIKSIFTKPELYEQTAAQRLAFLNEISGTLTEDYIAT